MAVAKKKPTPPKTEAYKFPLFEKTHEVALMKERAFHLNDAHMAITLTAQHDVLLQVISAAGLYDAYQQWLGLVAELEAKEASDD